MPEAQENTPVTNPDIVIGGRQFSNPNNLQPQADDESPRGTPGSNPIPNWKKDRGVDPSSTEYTSALADRGQPREGVFEDTRADKKKVQDLLNDDDAWKEESFNNTQSLMRRASGPVVAVPGVGNVQFPVSMEMDKIHAAAKKLYDGAAKLASNASQAVGGPSNLADATQGTVAGLSHPVETGKAALKSVQNIPAEHGRLLLKARDAWKAGDKEAAAQHFFNSLLPLVGPTSDRAGEQLKKGDYVAGAGTTLGAILPLLFGRESGAAVAEKAESGLSEAGEVPAPKVNAESAPKPVAKVETVGSAAAAKADTDFFQRAKAELGSNASISKIALRAQQLKDASRQVTVNGSGESSASLEAINRVSSERAQGIKRFRVDTRSGKEIPIVGADAVDATAGPYDVILQRGPEGEVILDTGSKARPLGRKSSASQTAGSLLAGTGGVVAQRASKTDKEDKPKSDAGVPKAASAFKPTAEDAEIFKSWPVTGPKSVKGMVKPGNIDLTKRPLVHNPDGTASSLLSMSFGTDDGEVLVPKISPDGRVMSDKEAIAFYRKTGQHLGIFKDPDSADAYAQYIHNKQGAFQTWKNGGKYKPTVETTNRGSL